MKKIAAVLFIFCFTLSVFAQKPIKDLKPTVILISLDGFRYDYLEKFKPPVLNELAKTGVRAKWMTPSFPSKTFPNHYTIATGLYPEHHGIIENNISDFGTVFNIDVKRETQNARWWFGEPIWVTAQKQGEIAASYFFPGTEAPIAGVLPRYYKKYDGKAPNDLRVDTVLSWLDLPQEKRPQMISLYFSDPDDAAHSFSPDSEETRYAVLNVDRLVGRLMDGLRARRIDDKANVIIVSDHGMATIDLHRAVFLNDYFDLDALAKQILWTDEIVQIFPKDGKDAEIISRLKNIQHAKCWLKKDIPARFHYNDSPRIAPVICSTEEGWILTNPKRYDDKISKNDIDQPHGGHGYDNFLPSMRATFIAHGAAFKKGFVSEPFDNIQVYNLMCKILGLTPAKNDGDFETVRNMLR